MTSLARSTHLVRRFVGSLSRRPPPPDDDGYGDNWVRDEDGE